MVATYRLVDLESENSRLNEADGLSIDANETTTLLDKSDGGGLYAISSINHQFLRVSSMSNPFD